MQPDGSAAADSGPSAQPKGQESAKLWGDPSYGGEDADGRAGPLWIDAPGRTPPSRGLRPVPAKAAVGRASARADGSSRGGREGVPGLCSEPTYAHLQLN